MNNKFNNYDNVPSPCFKCEDRVVRCHSNCEKYGIFKANKDEILKLKYVYNKERDFFINKK